MEKSRRVFLAAAALAPLAPAGLLGACARSQGAPAPPGDLGATAEEALKIATRAHEELMLVPGLKMHGAEQIAMLVYPGMTMLDLVGPHYFFASMMGAKVHLVAKDETLAPIMGDAGLAVAPTISMKDCPKELDIIFAPGGTVGTIKAMEDAETIDFIADRGSRAAYVTSVCTGALVLGQAGLLEGRRATTHWAAHHLLPEFGAKPVDARVVTDGNRVTGAGVSAGLDFAIALVAEIRGEAYAKALQLQAEYAPEPPFNAGTLQAIGPELGTPMREMFATTVFDMKQAAANRRN
jgi:putative intracellular protease/amidase